MVGAPALEEITGSLKLLCGDLPWIHYTPPLILLYTKLCI
jgi:hypothetical protein